MKKLFFLMAAALVVLACSQSPEQKAETLIKESLKKTLFNPETYKPVETKVDSAFAPYDDTELYELIAKVGELNAKYEELERKAKFAKTSMAIYNDSYSTFGKNQYENDKAEYEEISEELEQVRKRALKLIEKIVVALKSEKKFIGYKAIHNYRADDNSGNTLIGNTVYFIDENFTEVKYAMQLDEYNEVQEGMTDLFERMEEAEAEDGDASQESEE